MGFRLRQKPVMRCSAIGGVGDCPPKAKVTRSNRVGCARFSLSFSAVCARGLELGLRLIPASKQSGGKSSPSAEGLATDDVGRKLAGPRATIDSINSWIGALGQPNPRYLIQSFA